MSGPSNRPRGIARLFAVLPVVAAWLAVPGAAHAAPHTWAGHDGTAETSVRYDEQGKDRLASGFDLPDGSVSSATSARLWIYARAVGCTPGATGTQRVYRSNGPLIAEFDPCDRWPTTAFGWTSFPVPLSLLYEADSSWNRFRIADLAGDRNADYAIDTGTDLGITDAAAHDNGTWVSPPGEAVWDLVLDGSTPALGVTPRTYGFGLVAPGTASAPRTFTATSTGTADIASVSSVSVGGAHSGDFVVTADTCTGVPLPLGATCTFAVTFAPTAIDVRSATVTVTGGSATRTVTVTGEGRSQPPRSAFATPDGAVVPRAQPVTGTVTDDLAVAYEQVTFAPELAVAPDVMLRATLSCDAARTACTWTVPTTYLLPGRYRVTASGVDRQGVTETPGPSITVVIV